MLTAGIDRDRLTNLLDIYKVRANIMGGSVDTDLLHRVEAELHGIKQPRTCNRNRNAWHTSGCRNGICRTIRA